MIIKRGEQMSGDPALSEDIVIAPKPCSDAHISSMQQYEDVYKQSIEDPERFWAEKAEALHWFKRWDNVLRDDNGFFKWFEGGQLNMSYNCLDRHLAGWRKNKAAIIWESDDGSTKTYTYQELHREVCRFANVLKKKGVRKGDRICVYLPMIPELAITLLACSRIGAVHSVVFAGFSPASLKDRIDDSGSVLLVTADGNIRKGKDLPMKNLIDPVLTKCKTLKHVLVVKRAGNKVTMKKNRDSWWHEEMSAADISNYCDPEPMHAEDSLFILYTSGTTGKPKGVLHTNGGYSVYAYWTTRWVFDIKDEDTYWCTADIGWITGHTYILYGPLLNGATSIMFEGVPTYPDPGRFWEIVEKYKVTVFYTAPTVVRALMKEGDDWINRHDLSSLRLLGSVGEPINPEAWLWYYNVIGKKRCPVVDTWWQTETGGILISPLPGATPLKPGSATRPLPGIVPAVFREDGTEAGIDESGYLVIKQPWPAMLRTVWGNPERYKETYFGKYPGIYLTGDGAKKDKDGYFWLLGRIDDVINVSGHRIGTAEIEGALVGNKAVAESAVVPYPHKIKGQAIYAFVTLKSGIKKSDKLKAELRDHVADVLGHIAKPDKIQFADALPKTRSGKIMRRILKAIAEGLDDVGNTTTLANPEIVDQLSRGRL